MFDCDCVFWVIVFWCGARRGVCVLGNLFVVVFWFIVLVLLRCWFNYGDVVMLFLYGCFVALVFVRLRGLVLFVVFVRVVVWVFG